MKVLVTGAGGFIGSHLTEELVRRGYDVRAFTLYDSQGSWGWLDHAGKDVKGQFEIFSGDIRDPQSARNAVKGCDAVLHLAALIAIPYSYVAPHSYVDTNVTGTLNLLTAAREFGVKRFIHTSTSEVYGTARSVPIAEDHPLQPQSPYSATKIAADCLALSFHHSFAMPVAILRPFNTYGPRQSTRAVIPTIITQLCAGQKDIKLGSLSPTRDFNFVLDTVNGFIALLNSEHGAGDVINFGSNFEISIGEAAQVICDVMGVKATVSEDAGRLRPANSEVERLWGDNGKALRLIGWRPGYGGAEGFRRGIEKTVEWFSDPRNLALYKVGGYTI
jgi:dTDP-glucose 4,6-dehydratase